MSSLEMGKRRLQTLEDVLVLRGYSYNQLDLFRKSTLAALIKSNNKQVIEYIAALFKFNIVEWFAFIKS